MDFLSSQEPSSINALTKGICCSKLSLLADFKMNTITKLELAFEVLLNFVTLLYALLPLDSLGRALTGFDINGGLITCGHYVIVSGHLKFTNRRPTGPPVEISRARTINWPMFLTLKHSNHLQQLKLSVMCLNS